MRSFIKAATFVAAAVAVFAVLAPSPVQAQDDPISFDKRTAHNNRFKATGYNPLKELIEGPYPNSNLAADSVEKRAFNNCNVDGTCGCDIGETKCGTECCENGCDKTGYFCKCPLDTPVDCGGRFCCGIGASCGAGSTCSTAATITTRIGSTPTTIVIGGGRNAGSNTKAASSFAAVLGAAALVFGA
ncbi:hypothetical protein BGW39_006706 [Mortierella sp. 14UC]|nr:hypothetical protein BGW39_006706 [Mortierella sp. 14UC]